MYVLDIKTSVVSMGTELVNSGSPPFSEVKNLGGDLGTRLDCSMEYLYIYFRGISITGLCFTGRIPNGIQFDYANPTSIVVFPILSIPNNLW